VTCPAGSYCDSEHMAAPIPCPAGLYCGRGVSQGTQCPPGTFNENTGAKDVESCTKCTPGFYCSSYGLVAPSGNCGAGYYCFGGASFLNPNSQEEGGFICASGGYCPEGSYAPQPCPQGTYGVEEGYDSPSDCTDCPAGSYCAGSSNSYPTGECEAGYYCDGASPSATQHTTPAGFYSTAGSAAPIPCAPGTYQPGTGTTHWSLQRWIFL
jgi:hypothetical protein